MLIAGDPPQLLTMTPTIPKPTGSGPRRNLSGSRGIHTVTNEEVTVRVTTAFNRSLQVPGASVKAVSSEREEVQATIVHTSQRYDVEMSDVLFEKFGVQDLNHMLGVESRSNAVRTVPAMERLEPVAGVGGLLGSASRELTGALASRFCSSSGNDAQHEWGCSVTDGSCHRSNSRL
jgi:hypothetical protein